MRKGCLFSGSPVYHLYSKIPLKIIDKIYFSSSSASFMILSTKLFMKHRKTNCTCIVCLSASLCLYFGLTLLSVTVVLATELSYSL